MSTVCSFEYANFNFMRKKHINQNSRIEVVLIFANIRTLFEIWLRNSLIL